VWKKIPAFGHSKGRWWGLGWNRGSHGDRAALLTYNAGSVLQLQAEPRATHAGFRLPLRYVTRLNDLASVPPLHPPDRPFCFYESLEFGVTF
jgi:hypothetical protein